MSGSVFPKAALGLKQFSCEFVICRPLRCFSLFAAEAEPHVLVSGKSNSSFTLVLSLNSQDSASCTLVLSLNSRDLLPPPIVFRASQVALAAKNLPPVQGTQETWVQFMGREDPRSRKRQLLLLLLSRFSRVRLCATP